MESKISKNGNDQIFGMKSHLISGSQQGEDKLTLENIKHPNVKDL